MDWPQLLMTLGPMVLLVIGVVLFFQGQIRKLHGQVLQLEDQLNQLAHDGDKMKTERNLLRKDLSQAQHYQKELKNAFEKKLKLLKEEISNLSDELDEQKEVVQTVQEPLSSATAKALEDSPLVSEILELFAKGESAIEIARKKGMQVGEVQLIKGLKKFKPKGS